MNIYPAFSIFKRSWLFPVRRHAGLWLAVVGLVATVQGTYGQSYLGLDGGFEGAATINNTAASSAAAGQWTKNSGSQTIALETTTVRTGAKALTITNGTTGRRVWSPLITATISSSSVTIQYYRRATSTTNTQQSQSFIGDGTVGGDSQSGTYTSVTAPNQWEKVTYTRSSNSYATIAGGFMTRLVGTDGSTISIDDVAIYLGAVDTTAPNAPGSAAVAQNAGSPATSLDVSWAPATGGVDAGGYLVVRSTSDPVTAPNANGIYAVANEVAAGMTVAYVGTATSFTDTGLSPSTQYFYRVYSFDKAYNYSGGAAANGTSASPVSTLIVTTGTSTAVTTTGATLGGNVTATGGTDATEQGIYYSTSSGFADGAGTKVSTTGSFGTGAFTQAVTGLSSGTNYYFKAFATNPSGTGYGTEQSFLTVPSAPATPTASAIESTGFIANWGSVTGAADYRLDVATDAGFTSLVSGFNNLTVVGTFRLVSPLTASTTYHVRVRAVNAGGTSTSSGTLVQTTAASAPPAIGVTPSSLTGFTYAIGSGPSASQTFAVSGSNLTGAPGSLTVTGSTSYEVSANNTTFDTSVSIPFNRATVGSTVVYARLKGGLPAASYNAENLTIAGGGASSQSVALSGSVTSITADLTIGVTAPATATTNANFTYTLTVSNSGAAAATGITAEFTVPAGLTYVSNVGASGFTGSFATGKVTFSNGSIPPGGNAILTVTVIAPTAGTYTAASAAAAVDPANAIVEGNETDNTSALAAPTAVADTPVLSAALASLTPQPTGTLIPGTQNVVLAGFTVTASGALDLTGVTVTLAGNATGSELSALEIFYDIDGNGAINGADAAVSNALAVGPSLVFVINGQALDLNRRTYLIVGDVGNAPVDGRSVTASIAAGAITVSAGTTSGIATGASRSFLGATAAQFTLHPTPVQTIAAEGTATLTATVTGAPTPTLQWYTGTTGDLSNPITGATSLSFTTPALTETTSYWVRTENSAGAADSNTAVVMVANADLSNLVLSSGALSPAFSPGETSYTAIVASGVSQITLIPTVVQEASVVSVNGTIVPFGGASAPVPLSVGNNRISISVVQAGLIAKGYIIDVFRQSSDADLSNLTLSGASLTPGFSAANLGYTSVVPFSTTSVTVTPTAAAGFRATIRVNGTVVNSGEGSAPISLNQGANTIAVAVTSQDGTNSKTYQVDLTRLADSRLTGLTISPGLLSPAFSPSVVNYAATVPFATTSLTIAPVYTAAGATAAIAGIPVASGTQSAPVALGVGANLIAVVVTGSDSSTSYNLTVTREADPALSNLQLSQGSLTPEFLPESTSYTALVSSSVTALTLTPTLRDPGASVTVNGIAVASGAESTSIPLSRGPNEITVVTTSSDGLATLTYTVVVTQDSAEIEIRSGAVSLVSGSSIYSMGGTSPGRIRTRELTIHNAGGEPLTGLSVVFSGDLQFSGSLPNGVTELAGGASTVLTINFAPVDFSTRTGAVAVSSSDDDESPFVVALSASGDHRLAKPIEHPAVEGATASATRTTWDAGFVGRYDGLLRASTDSTEILGCISNLVITAPTGANTGGVLSGTARFKGRSIPLSGAFRGSSGIYETSRTTADGSTISISLQLMRTTGGKAVLRGSAVFTPTSGARTVATIDLAKAPYHERTNRAPIGLIGKYTMILPSAPGSGSAEPGGDGWAAANINAGGVITVSGALGDGTKFTETAYLSEDFQASLYSDLYASTPERGRFGGTLIFREQPGVSDFDGLMQWIKFSDSREARYRSGFDVDVWAVGSHYLPPVSGRVLTQLANEVYNAELSLIGPTAPVAGVSGHNRVLTWLDSNKLVHYGPEKLSGGANPTTGAVTGSFTLPAGGAVISFSGAALQKQGVVGGVFVNGNASGALRILPGVDFPIPGSEDAGPLALLDTPLSGATGPAEFNSPFSTDAAGAFGGILNLTGIVSGAIESVVLTKTGTLSGTLWIEGVRQSFRGSMANDGSVNVTTPSGTIIALQLTGTVGSLDGFGLAGTVQSAGTTYQLDAQRRPVFTTIKRAPQEGAYTVAIRAPDGTDSQSEPGGDGYGTLTVNYLGVCAGRITLADGTEATLGGHVGPGYLDGATSVAEWSLHSGLYGRTPSGYLSGKLTFRSIPGVSDLDGEWKWVKQPGASPSTIYPNGFVATRKVIGSEYSARPTGTPAMGVLAGAAFNVWLRWSGPDLSTLPALNEVELDRAATWSTTNTVIYGGPETAKLTFNSRTGLLTGTYLDSAKGIKIAYGGVLLQVQNLVSGSYRAQGKSGLFSVEPRTP